MKKVIDFFKEIITSILMGLLVSIIGNVIGFLDHDSILPIIIAMIAGAIVKILFME